MFFIKHIKPEKLLADIEDLKGDLNRLSEKVKKTDSEIEELRRIIKNYSPNEITGYAESYFCNLTAQFIGIPTASCLHVFKDGKEYIFEDLYIEDPEFTQGEKQQIVYVKPKGKFDNYVLDLYRKTWVKIGYGKDEDKN